MDGVIFASVPLCSIRLLTSIGFPFPHSAKYLCGSLLAPCTFWLAAPSLLQVCGPVCERYIGQGSAKSLRMLFGVVAVLNSVRCYYVDAPTSILAVRSTTMNGLTTVLMMETLMWRWWSDISVGVTTIAWTTDAVRYLHAVANTITLQFSLPSTVIVETIILQAITDPILTIDITLI